jgi:hypothetical protein
MIEFYPTFFLHYMIRQEGALLVPRLQDAKQRMSLLENRFATIKVMQWLALASVEAGQLHQAYEECLAGLDLLEQLVGYRQQQTCFGTGGDFIGRELGLPKQQGKFLSFAQRSWIAPLFEQGGQVCNGSLARLPIIPHL